jgi:hypothetical protein
MSFGDGGRDEARNNGDVERRNHLVTDTLHILHFKACFVISGFHE